MLKNLKISKYALIDELNIDFTCDYSEDIKEDVDDVVAASTSLQEELTKMEKVTQ